jgi:membrane-bound lytic murein transglycosylase F
MIKIFVILKYILTKKKTMKIIKYLFILQILLVSISCSRISTPKPEAVVKSKLQEIIDQGVLKVVTDFNSSSYFIYRGQPMGYQYDMLQELANHLGVRLEVLVNNKTEEKFKLLEEGKVDLIAANLAVTKERRQRMDFTVAHTQTRQVLIQRKPITWSNRGMGVFQDSLIRSQVSLAQKEVYVPRNSPFAQRLHSLSDEIGDSIKIIEVDESVESLVEKVAKGEIKYTVSDYIEARVYENYYSNLDIETPLSFSQNLAWAVPKGSDDLKNVINVWLTDFKKSKKYALLYRKYFQNKRSAEFFDKDFFANISGKISPYDAMIKECSEKIGWDWRLVASVIYQESRFNPQAKSWAGAYGLMQLMPNTAQRFGVTQGSPPIQHIKAGVMFLQWLDNKLTDIKDPAERQKFVLASYNIGLGHVLDARALAAKNGKDPNVWDGSVVDFLLSKSDPNVYSDPVVKYGYCRGTETNKYVAEVIQRYEHYKNLIKR